VTRPYLNPNSTTNNNNENQHSSYQVRPHHPSSLVCHCLRTRPLHRHNVLWRQCDHVCLTCKGNWSGPKEHQMFSFASHSRRGDVHARQPSHPHVTCEPLELWHSHAVFCGRFGKRENGSGVLSHTRTHTHIRTRTQTERHLWSTPSLEVYCHAYVPATIQTRCLRRRHPRCLRARRRPGTPQPAPPIAIRY